MSYIIGAVAFIAGLLIGKFMPCSCSCCKSGKCNCKDGKCECKTEEKK